jgi:hypothetical protein
MYLYRENNVTPDWLIRIELNGSVSNVVWSQIVCLSEMRLVCMDKSAAFCCV